jgi:hypothetical protein
MRSPPLSGTHDKHDGWGAAGEGKSTLLLPSAAAAGAGAASSLMVAHMRHDESQPDVESLEDEKMRNLGYDADGSVSSFNEDASTVAASEAPTYLSGSTFYETHHDPGKLEDSPSRPGTLSYFLGNLGKRGPKTQIREDVWSPRGISSSSSSSKKGTGEPGQSREREEHEGSTQADPQPVVEVQAKDTQETSAAGQVEQRTPPAPIDPVEDIINPPKLERSASARRKSKKKAGKKGVSWSEPWPEHQEEEEGGGQIDDASSSTQNPGDQQQQTTPSLPHEAPAGKEAAGEPSGELEQHETESAPAEPTTTKTKNKGIFGSSFSILPSIFAGPGSLLGIGKRLPGQADQHQHQHQQDAPEKGTKQQDQDQEAQVESSRAAEFPVSSERHDDEQQHTGEPLQLHDKDTPKAEPAPDPVPPAVDEASQQEAVPEPETNAEPAPASEEPSSVTNRVADGDEAAEPAGKTNEGEGEGKEGEQDAALIEETPAVVESVAPETVPEPALPDENPQQSTAAADVETAAVETPADDDAALAEPAASGKKSKKRKKKKQASQDASASSPSEIVTEQSTHEGSEEPMITTDLPQQEQTGDGQGGEDVPPEPSSSDHNHEPMKIPPQPVEEPSPLQGDASLQADDEVPESGTKSKKSKKKKKKGGPQQAAEAETTVQPSTLETQTQTEAAEVPQEAESVAPETPAEQQVPAPDVPQQLEPSSQETQQDQQRPESEMPSPTTDVPPEPESVAPDTQPEVSGEAGAGIGHEIDNSSTSEAAKSGVSATDERPSSPDDETAQQEIVHPIQEEEDDALTDSPSEERKKKRHSVAFAEPLVVELLEPTNATGEEDNDRGQNTRDSKDSGLEVPTVVPLQSGDSVDGQPAHSDARTHPSAQVVGEVGVTAPSLSLSDAVRDGAESGSDTSSQQDNIELEDSRSLDRPAEMSKGQSQTGLSEETSDECKPFSFCFVNHFRSPCPSELPAPFRY